MMHKLKFSKNIMIIIVCCTIMSMTIICASFSQNMFVSGDAYVRSSKNIRITDVKVKSADNGAIENSANKYSSKNMIVNFSLPNLDSKITYTITIENKSSDVYLIKNITNSFNNENISNNSDEYINQVISANETVDVDITFEYSVLQLPQTQTQSGVMTFIFDLPAASAIAYSSEYTDVDNVQDAIDELYDLFDE